MKSHRYKFFRSIKTLTGFDTFSIYYKNSRKPCGSQGMEESVRKGERVYACVRECVCVCECVCVRERERYRMSGCGSERLHAMEERA